MRLNIVGFLIFLSQEYKEEEMCTKIAQRKYDMNIFLLNETRQDNVTRIPSP